jgi:hypothetical protein
LPYNNKIDPLITTHDPIGCHLQAIYSVAGCFDIVTGAKAFDTLLEHNHGSGVFGGAHFTGTIVSIRLPDEKTIAALEKRGFKLLGTQEGAHGDYEMALYGLGFTLPRTKKGKKEQ